jgi:hypothetical protein
MKLINELIEQLSDENAHLSGILLKAKILAHRIGNTEMANWVNSEINGYGSNELPPYRIIRGQLVGPISNGYVRYPEVVLPTRKYEKEFGRDLNEINLGQSISALENIPSDPASGELGIPLGPETFSPLSKYYEGGFHVESARVRISPGNISSVLAQIRSKLLDLLLAMDSNLTDSGSSSESIGEKKKAEFRGLFQSAMFGDNTTIIIGNNNTQIVDVEKQNFASVKKVLLTNRVSAEDVHLLEEIIDVDNLDPEKKKFGDKTRGWIATMLSKAMDGTWQIQIGIASELLAHIIKRYLGWNP